MTRPVCKCHGQPMWKNNSDGGWRCRVKAGRRHYFTDRRADLRRQRARVLEELETLARI